MQVLPSPGGGSNEAPPVVLSIAGFDPSSGAGVTADLKVFAAFGLFGVAAPTALTVQSTQGVRGAEMVRPGLLADMLECLAADVEIAGVKIGMLGSAAVVAAVTEWLARYSGSRPELPVVLDPVLRSSSGAALLDEAGVEQLRERLLPLCTVATPNAQEAAELCGQVFRGRTGVEEAADAVLRRVRPGRWSGVLVTGGDLENNAVSEDYLLCQGEQTGRWLRADRVHTRATHGTGCALSSALLCGLVRGDTLEAASSEAKQYVREAMLAAYPIGRGRGPLHHLFGRGPGLATYPANVSSE
ncbi:bifunctional hydroxymethylpyrimidine kinase/phosphomethylpyrimidine kinase [Acidipila sp. EB88]|uniref:bifunctional hydroxymethylpyrimidine kinase/phosphomethylpyrimidine kinase n=1 Tax=Acidipila sp. EB88 TaxID=2305226 RepID=UPI000F5F5BD4|nr:bifunctional hydroxymethylpyrimidine kinase/phosphomethylpyrimidine kinase [Acidipila sp. EB88]RRA49511.1 bifunctional hydroxymethylpyrimidine kinase/phosphomethylpyrimidine kinase [Acidipila sp. EB88]